MAGQKNDREGSTYDPNANAIWPVYPSGARQPIRRISPLMQTLMAIILLAVMAGAGLLVWLFVGAVHGS